MGESSESGDSSRKVIVLLPALNEELAIQSIIDDISKQNSDDRYCLEILLVDGNSVDRTVEIARKNGIEVLIQANSNGKAGGISEAIEHLKIQYATGEGPDAVIMLDSDGSYPPGEIGKLLQVLENKDVVSGNRLNRMSDPKSISNLHKFGNFMLSITASALYLRRIKDVCTGYWGFNMSALSQIQINSKGFNLEAEIYSKMMRNKSTHGEIDIPFRRRAGDSSLVWYKDGPSFFFSLLYFRFFG